MDYVPIASWIINGLLAIVVYFLRNTIEDNKNRMTKLETKYEEIVKDITAVKVTYLPKDDFSEFKEELWRKLDDIKQIVKHNND